MEKPGNLLHAVRKRVQAVAYGNPIYKLVLDQGPIPDRFRLALSDPWPGNAVVGQALLSGPGDLFEDPAEAWRQSGVARRPTRLLRDLRAVGTEAARQKAAALIAADMDKLESWQDEAWHPEALGERLSAWIAFHDFYIGSASEDFQNRLIQSLLRQLRHLLHLQPTLLPGVAGLRVVKGLIYGGLTLVESEKALSSAFELLRQKIMQEILADGGHISRSPAEQLHFLRYLIDIRTALKQVEIEMPSEVDMAIDRMIPPLKLFRHGDGALAMFQGGGEESSLWLDAALTLSEARGRVARRLPQMGYERLTAGRSLLLADVGGAPPRPFDTQSHAGLMSFEFSVGRERLIVNCGAATEGDMNWRQALAATAAHSTLTLEDTNAVEVMAGGLGHKRLEVKAQRFEQDGAQAIEISHDGYASRFNVYLQRTLTLSANGEELTGREVLAGKVHHDFALRWHLHPSVQVSLAQSGQAALLRTPSGAGWRLRVKNGDLALEPSVYCSHGKPRRSLQLKLSGRASDDPTMIEWTLSREKR